MDGGRARLKGKGSVRGSIASQRARSVGIVRRRLSQENLGRHPRKWLLAREQMVEERGEGENLRLVVVRLRESNLGRHVPKRSGEAGEAAHLQLLAAAHALLPQLAQPKVGEDGPPIRRPPSKAQQPRDPRHSGDGVRPSAATPMLSGLRSRWSSRKPTTRPRTGVSGRGYEELHACSGARSLA